MLQSNLNSFTQLKKLVFQVIKFLQELMAFLFIERDWYWKRYWKRLLARDDGIFIYWSTLSNVLYNWKINHKDMFEGMDGELQVRNIIL